MLSRTHSSAATWSSRPRLTGASFDLAEALEPDPVVERSRPRRRPARGVLPSYSGRPDMPISCRRRPGSRPSPAAGRRTGRATTRWPSATRRRSRPARASMPKAPPCGGGGPNISALRTPVQPGVRRGAASRRGPTGGSANGMPRKTAVPASQLPRSVPAAVWTSGSRLGSTTITAPPTRPSSGPRPDRGWCSCRAARWPVCGRAPRAARRERARRAGRAGTGATSASVLPPPAVVSNSPNVPRATPCS